MVTVVELRAQAKALGLRGYSRLRKADLVQLIADGIREPIPNQPVPAPRQPPVPAPRRPQPPPAPAPRQPPVPAPRRPQPPPIPAPRQPPIPAPRRVWEGPEIIRPVLDLEVQAPADEPPKQVDKILEKHILPLAIQADLIDPPQFRLVEEELT